MKRFWKKYHKWVGLFFTFFILMFCFSGIILNHRHFFSGCNVSRSWLPGDYHYDNWNNGAVRGTFRMSNNDVLTYGNTGIWKTDSCFSVFSSFNGGLRQGIDHHKISNIVTTSDGTIWCAGLYDVYRLSADSTWQLCTPAGTGQERIADVCALGDTLVVLSRSYVFEALPPYKDFRCYELPRPADYSEKVSLFRTVWMIHSGELWGLPGQFFVDFVALVIVVLCLTGLFYLFIPKAIRHRNKQHLPVKREARLLKCSVRWHNHLGAWTLFFTVLLAATGMCLRPPLMIPLVMANVSPVPGSTMDSDNPWHDKLRSLRWDAQRQQWLMSTSAGFYSMPHFTAVPEAFECQAPVSPMGINVFHQTAEGDWLIGSFSGLFRWNISRETVKDYFSGEDYHPTFGRPIASHAISGFSTDLTAASEVIFDYSKGARLRGEEPLAIPSMPEEIQNQPMSLWNFALELHVGRCYSPFLGPLSSLFVFLSGLLLTLILVSGYILHRKPHKENTLRSKVSKTKRNE